MVSAQLARGFVDVVESLLLMYQYDPIHDIRASNAVGGRSSGRSRKGQG